MSHYNASDSKINLGIMQEVVDPKFQLPGGHGYNGKQKHYNNCQMFSPRHVYHERLGLMANTFNIAVQLRNVSGVWYISVLPSLLIQHCLRHK